MGCPILNNLARNLCMHVNLNKSSVELLNPKCCFRKSCSNSVIAILEKLQNWKAGETTGKLAAREDTYLVKIGNNLIKKAQTLDTLIVSIKFDIKFVEIRNRCKHDSNFCIRLMV